MTQSLIDRHDVELAALAAAGGRREFGELVRRHSSAEVDDAAPDTDQAGLVDLDEALKTLSEPERLCVSLCHGAGLSHPEIATALNLPLGTVKSHVKRGLDKLRARLQPQPQTLGRSTHVS